MALSIVDSYSESNYSSTSNVYSGTSARGQSFTCSSNADITYAKFYLRKSGSPTGSCYAKLYTHTGTFGTSSVPTNPLLATSNAVDVSTLSGTLSLVKFTFSTTYSMVAGTKYVIVFEYNGGNSSNYVVMGRDSTSPSHAGNYSYANPSWASTNTVDLIFYVYSGQDTPATSNNGFFILAR